MNNNLRRKAVIMTNLSNHNTKFILAETTFNINSGKIGSNDQGWPEFFDHPI
jgi:hypothetical protein